MEKRTLSSEEIITQLNLAFDELDESRITEMEMTREFLITKHNAQLVEHGRLLRKYGPSHMKVHHLNAQIEYRRVVVPALEDLLEISKIKVEPFIADSWRVHGFVSGAKGNPLPDMIVFIALEKRVTVDKQGSAVTNEKGYYSITLDKEMVDKLKDQSNLFLHVAGKNKKSIHVEKNPVTPVSGVIDAVNISIQDIEYRATTKKGKG